MRKNILILSLAIITLSLAITTPVFSANWYEGGNLHSSSIKKWNSADYSNRLATSADWFLSITKSHNKKLYSDLTKLDNRKYLSQLRNFSSQLEKCVSDIASERSLSKPNDQIADIASTCYLSMYGSD